MTNDLFSLIREKLPSFTRAERKVASMVLQTPQLFVNMSITQTAMYCGVSDTSVFRFCRMLNLEGYQDFKMSLVQSLSNGGASLSTLSDQISVKDDTDEVCRKLLAANIEVLKQTYDQLDSEKIRRAVAMIESARMIHFYGMGSSGVIALEAKNRFARILPNLVFEADSHMQEMSSALLGPEDLAIAFSYSGSAKDTISILKRAKKKRGPMPVCHTLPGFPPDCFLGSCSSGRRRRGAFPRWVSFRPHRPVIPS